MAALFQALAGVGIILFFGMASSGCPDIPKVQCTNDESCASFAAESCMQGRCVAGNCIAEPKDGFCFIDGVCFTEGQSKPAEPCLVCDGARDEYAFVDKTCAANETCDALGMCMAVGGADVVVGDADATTPDAETEVSAPDADVVAGPDGDADAAEDTSDGAMETIDAPDGTADTADAGPDVPAVTEPDPASATQIALLHSEVTTSVGPVVVTYVRPPHGDDWPGFTVQATADGPAVMLTPGEGTAAYPDIVPGDIISFDATLITPWYGMVEVTGVQNLVVLGSGYDVTQMTQDITQTSDVTSALDDYAVELVTASFDVLPGTQVDAGVAYTRWDIDLPNLTGDTNLSLRVPNTLADQLGDLGGCKLTTSHTPLWRFFEQAQVSAWHADEIAFDQCPDVKAVSAQTPTDTTVVVSFNRAVQASSLAEDGNQFTIPGLTVTGASLANPLQVVLTTGAQTSGDYTVSVEGVQCIAGTTVDAAHAEVTFTVAP